jgi:hypothetical protein
MLLKDFPEDFSLGYSVHVLGLMLQSILLRASEIIEARADEMQGDESRAFEALTALLEAALRDAEGLQRKMLN